MQAFEVPGVAIAIVKDGKPVVLKGYGVRRLGDSGRVDEHTLFGIASNTKAFTAGALAILAEEGKVKWDDPVQKHLPSFQTYDPYVSRELTVRDLLSHRSGLGLGAGDLLFWPDTDAARADVVAAARHIKPASSIRSKYAYNNLAFVVAGEVVAAVSGKPWDDFVRDRIFDALGMKDSRITSDGLTPASNAASPHSRGWRLEGTLKPIAHTRDHTWAAAAGIRSSVSDLARWVALQLNEGKLQESKRLWSAALAKDMWSPQTILPISEPSIPALKAAKANFSAYGLGWSLRDYKGRKLVSHGGALTGMLSMTMMVPDERLGVVVLTNQEEGGAMSAIVFHILDHYFKLSPSDWIDAYKQQRAGMLKRPKEAEAKLEAGRARGTTPSLALEKYAADYRDPWYGGANIREQNGKLVLRMSRTPAMVGDLEHWHYDTFKAVWRDPTIPDAFVTFALNARGQIDSMKMEAVSQLADFSFDYQDLHFTPIKLN
jgi:CubicO group peptidase (beta-lactamase class C family)